MCGRVRDRRDYGEFYRVGGGAPPGVAAGRLGCRSAGIVWRAAGYDRHRRGGACFAHQSAGVAGIRPGTGRARTSRQPGEDAVEALPNWPAQQSCVFRQGMSTPGRSIPRRLSTGPWVRRMGARGWRVWPLGSSRASPRHLDGYDRADSWATDAHKWLNVPMIVGWPLSATSSRYGRHGNERGILTADRAARAGAIHSRSSRRARGIEIWAALRSLGRSGVADLIERTCQLATQFAEGLQASGIPILNDVVLNQVLVTFGDQARTERIIAALQDDGTSWFGPTIWHGHLPCVSASHPGRPPQADVERSLAAITRIVATIE